MVTTNACLLMWHMYGLEGCKAITEYEQLDRDNVIRILKGEKAEPNPLNSLLRSWMLRALFNPHRHYEIWTVDCESNTLTEQDWYDMFDSNPQHCAEMVRSHGVCYYSDRIKTERQVIT